MTITTKKGWQAHKDSNLSLSRAYVRQYAPYLGATLYGLIPVPIEHLSELAGGPLGVTERLVLIYDPEWVETVSTIILATGLAHECLHHQLMHVKRGKLFADRKRANVAADLFINGSMRAQMKTVRVPGKQGGSTTQSLPMWEFPVWAAMPKKYGFPDGLTMDEYYKLLESANDGGKSKGKGESGDSQEGDEDKSQIMNGCCGGIAGNEHSKELENTHNQEVGRSDANCASIARETGRAIKRHMEATNGVGSLPGQWAELIDISDKVFNVPWRTKLANVTKTALGNIRTGGLDYSIRRPSKRSYLRGITLPGLISYDPIVEFIVDSSGSMGTEQLMDAKRVVTDVLQQTGIQKAWFFEADVDRQREPVLLGIQELREIEIRGRGGTSFIPAIDYVDKEQYPRPQLVVYITDGCGSAPKEQPRGITFIWAIVPSSFQSTPAEWGEIIVLEDDDVSSEKSA